MCRNVFIWAYVHMWILRLPSDLRDMERVPSPWNWSYFCFYTPVTISCHVDASNQTWVFCGATSALNCWTIASSWINAIVINKSPNKNAMFHNIHCFIFISVLLWSNILTKSSLSWKSLIQRLLTTIYMLHHIHSQKQKEKNTWMFIV